MKQIKKISFLILLSIYLNSCSNESNEIPIVPETLSYREILNVSYGNDNQQVFDIYLPENRDLNTKVMILVHGGGWTSGDKSEMNSIKDLYLQNLPNIAIVNINYRLSTQNNPPYPMQIDDITAIINYLKANKNEYVISENFGFLGVSAGGHLALLWSYAFDSNNNVNMVASIVGPTNFTDPAYLNNTNPVLQALLNIYGINTSIEFLEEISPLHRVKSTSPPTILFYGGQDPLVPSTQGIDMRDRLIELGVENNFILYPNAGHGWEGVDLLDTWNKIITFTNSNL